MSQEWKCAVSLSRVLSLLIAGCFLSPTSSASACHTLSAGLFTDTAIWDCGCNPLACDTLTILHPLTTDALLVLANDFVHITPTGALTSEFQVSMFSHLLNEGVVDVFRLYQTQLSPMLRNVGTLDTEEALFWGDSVVNTSVMHTTTMLQTRPWTRVLNEGRMDGHYLEVYELYNYDTLSFDTASLRYVQVNLGYAEFHNAITESGSWANEANGVLVADSIIILDDLDNYGLVIANDLLQFGNDTTSNGDLSFFPSSARIECRNLKNYGHIQGFGDICIQDSSINYVTGLISQLPDICDATCNASEPPFLDVNLGSVIGNVGWCAETSCVTAIENLVLSDQLLEVYPVPAQDQVHIRSNLSGDVRAVRLTDPTGTSRIIVFSVLDGAIRMDRGMLAPGLYYAELLGRDSTRLGIARLLFIDP